MTLSQTEVIRIAKKEMHAAVTTFPVTTYTNEDALTIKALVIQALIDNGIKFGRVIAETSPDEGIKLYVEVQTFDGILEPLELEAAPTSH